MLADHYHIGKFGGTVRLPIPKTNFLLKPTNLRFCDLTGCPPSMYFVPDDITSLNRFHLTEHPKILVFQFEDGTRRRIFLETGTYYPAESHVRDIGVEPPVDGPGFCQEYHWKLDYRDELEREAPVKLYWIGGSENVVFHTVSIPLDVLKVVGYYSDGVDPVLRRIPLI
jgi:hypothetical protein